MATTAAPTITPITHQDARSAAEMLAKLYLSPLFLQKEPRFQTIVQTQINIIDAAIDQNIISLQALYVNVPDQRYSIKEVIRHFIEQGATSKYVE